MPETQELTLGLEGLLELLLTGVAADGVLVAMGSADEALTVLAARPAGLSGRRLPLSETLMARCGEGVQPTTDLLLPSALSAWLGLRPGFFAAAKLKLDVGEGCLYFWWKQEPANRPAIGHHVATAARIVASDTRRQASAKQLVQIQDRMDVLLEHVSLGIVFVDSLRGSLLNEVAAGILNLPEETRDSAAVVAAMRATREACEVRAAEDEVDAEYWISTGRDMVLRVESHPVGDTQTPGRFWVFTDVKPLWDSTECTKSANRVLERNLDMLVEEMERRMEAEAKLREYNLGLKQQNEQLEIAKLESDFQANHDPLTGLANRRRFRHALEDMVAEARLKGGSVVLLYLDLDKFKPVNDSLGHERGDELLRTVAETLTDVLRQDDLVARLGGDEFVCALRLAASTPPRELAPLIDKLRERLKFSVECADTTIHVSATIGVAIYPDDASDATSLLRAGDNAMYLGKRQGGGEIVAFGKAGISW